MSKSQLPHPTLNGASGWIFRYNRFLSVTSACQAVEETVGEITVIGAVTLACLSSPRACYLLLIRVLETRADFIHKKPTASLSATMKGQLTSGSREKPNWVALGKPRQEDDEFEAIGTFCLKTIGRKKKDKKEEAEE